MTLRVSDEHDFIVELLPIYASGKLEDLRAGQVREHLATCDLCQRELASWEVLQGVTRLAASALPLPSEHLMAGVWSRIDAASALDVQTQRRWSWSRVFSTTWQLFRSQVPIIPRSVWLASALVCVLGLILTFVMVLHASTVNIRHAAGSVLVLFIIVAGSSGCAFIYGSSIDPGFEWTIATPTSMRLIMLCRMGSVLLYNLLLGMLASAVFTAATGGSLWEMVQLWLGPLIFLSSLCLALSLFLSTAFALTCTMVLGMLQVFPTAIMERLIGRFAVPLLSLDPRSPVLWIGALVLLVCVVCFLPRQPSMSS